MKPKPARLKIVEIRIEVPNLRPLPANNSKKAFVNKRTGKPVIVDRVKGRAGYLKTIKLHASMIAARQNWPIGEVFSVHYSFYFKRPKDHYGTGKNARTLKASAPDDHLVKPDVDNLVKPVKDALTGILWQDDCAVVRIKAEKHWSEVDAVVIEASTCIPIDEKETDE